MPLLTDTTTGLERITREALIILIGSLNAEIKVQEAAWTTLDKDFAVARKVAFEAAKIEKIASDNFYPGHKPSLIEAPITKYPNLCAMAYSSANSDMEEFDQVEAFQDFLFIELMCKAVDSESRDPEELVYKRVSRTIDAIVKVIQQNNTLNGLVVPVETAPDIDISNVFLRPEYTGSGESFVWQGARLEYVFEKIAIY